MTDHNGRPFSNDDLKGKFALLYFGFTHCPDICPDELMKLAEAVDLIGAWHRPLADDGTHPDGDADASVREPAEKHTGKQVQPVFVSVDPARDNVKQVRQYVKGAHQKPSSGAIIDFP